MTGLPDELSKTLGWGKCQQPAPSVQGGSATTQGRANSTGRWEMNPQARNPHKSQQFAKPTHTRNWSNRSATSARPRCGAEWRASEAYRSLLSARGGVSRGMLAAYCFLPLKTHRRRASIWPHWCSIAFPGNMLLFVRSTCTWAQSPHS